MLIKLGLVFAIGFVTLGLFKIGNVLGNMNKVVYASNMSGYSVSDTVKTKEVKVAKVVQNRGKILLYSSHSCEKNTDSTIIQITENLAKKLTAKGFQVEHDKSLFADQQGYNRSYHSSGAMLDKKDLSQYVLCIDCHMDSTPKQISASYNNNDVAKLMFPNVSENPNLKAETQIVDKIKDGLSTFNEKIYRENVTHYKKGIIYYCLDKSPNMILMEIGSDKNNFYSCARANTLVASAIERAFK